MYYPGCTIAAKHDRKTESYILASNSDNPPHARTKVTVRQGRKFRFIGTELVSGNGELDWENMITRGVNEAGLAYTFSYVDIQSALKTAAHQKIHFKHFGDDILGGCSNLEEVHEYLNSSRPIPHGNFLFADPHGKFRLYELVPGRAAKPEAVTKEVIRTNHYVTSDVEETDYARKSESYSRLQAATAALLQEANADSQAIAALTAVLTSHTSPNGTPGGSPCNHGPDFGTVSSETIEPAAQRLSYHYGPACESRNSGEKWANYIQFDLPKIPADFTGDLTNVDGNVLYSHL